MNAIGRAFVLAALAVLAGCRSDSLRRSLVVFRPRASTTAATLPSHTAHADQAAETPISALPITQASAGSAAPRETPNIQLAAARMPIVEALPVPGNERSGAAPLTFEWALALALAQNPDLNAARGNQDVGVAALGVAQTYPFNPQYFTQTTPWSFIPLPDGSIINGAVNTQHQLLETFELRGQRQYRAAAGGAALNAIRWSIHQTELRTLADTQRLYFAALYQREVRDVAAMALRINEQVLDLQGRRFLAGQATPADLAQSKLDNRAARRQLDLAEANYQTAVLDLERQLNWWSDVPLEPVDRLSDWQWRPAAETAGVVQWSGEMPEKILLAEELTAAVARRPDVQAAAAEVDVARANLELANANRTPNLIVGPFYEYNEAGVTLYGFKGGFDIPVVNTGKPLVRQRQAELAQRQNTYHQLLVKATTEARAALQRYERARRLVERSRKDFEADFPDELRQVEDQFRAGQVEILRLFAARTTLLQDRRAYLDLHNELAQAAAAVTLATGLPPEAMVQRIGPEPLP